MCYPVRCPQCGGTTWDGCGLHVEDALAGVPAEQLCTCADDRTEDRVGAR